MVLLSVHAQGLLQTGSLVFMQGMHMTEMPQKMEVFLSCPYAWAERRWEWKDMQFFMGVTSTSSSSEQNQTC